MRKPRRGPRLPASRTWFLALGFAVAAFAILHGPDAPGGGPGHLTPAFWPTSSKAYAAATDYFLNVDGIPGDSTVSGYAGQIVINSWQFGIGRTTTIGNPASAGKVNCAEFVFGKILDKSSPGLLRESLDGEAIPKVVLSGTRTASPDGLLFLRITFTSVLESSYAMSSGGDVPTESVSFNYGSLLVEYRAQGSDGSFGPPVSSSYDCLQQRTIGGGGAPTVTTVAASGSPTYGSPVTLNATVTSSAGTPTGTVAFSTGNTMLCPAATVSAGAATCQTSALTVGTNPVAAAYSPDTSAFAASSGSATISVAPAPLSVTTNPATKVYGSANPSFTAAYSGLVNGDTASSLSGTLVFATPATAASPVGAYDVTPGGLSSTNYAINFVAGTLSVTAAALTVTADPSSRVYGAANPSFTASYSGFVDSDDPTVLGGTLGFTTGATAASAVGNYPVTPGGLTSTNYSITFVAGPLTVTPAPLTATANDASKVYGQANPAFSASFSGFVNGDGPAALGGTLSFATAATTASGVGGYPVTPGGLISTNYTITFVAGTLTVTPALLTVAANDSMKVYGQPNPAFSASYNGFVNGDGPGSLSGTLSFATVATGASPAGTYGVTPGGLTSTNYTITFLVGTLTVTPAPLTVTTVNSSKIYGAPNPAFTVSFSGFVNGDGPASLGGTLSFSTAATAASPVGNYAVTPSGFTSINYAITFVAGNLAVTPAPLTVTADNKTRPFGAANPAFTASYAGFVNGDGPGSLGGVLTFTTPATTASPVGVYPITPSGLNSSNYTITYVPGKLVVTPAAVTLTLTVVVRDDDDDNKLVLLRAAASPVVLAGSVLTGTVQFYLDGSLLSGVETLNSDGVATHAIRVKHPHRTHVARAVFSSSNANFASAEATLSFVLPHGGGDDSSWRKGDS